MSTGGWHRNFEGAYARPVHRLALVVTLLGCGGSSPPPEQTAHVHDPGPSPIAAPAELPDLPATEEAEELRGSVIRLGELIAGVKRQLGFGIERANEQRDIVWLSCLDDKRRQVLRLEVTFDEHEVDVHEVPDEEVRALVESMHELCGRALMLQEEARQCI